MTDDELDPTADDIQNSNTASISATELRSFRKQRALTQQELASSLGVSQKVLSAWERGTREIPFEMQARLRRFLGLAERSSGNAVTDVVLVVHGIRDHGVWHKMVAGELETATIRVFGIKYGYFDVFRFLSPFPTSRKPAEVVERAIRTARQAYPQAQLSIVAHSFGTFLVTRILQDKTDIHVRRLLLCGAVVEQEFRWDRVKNQIGEPGDGETSRYIVNECGSRDVWPVLGKAAGWRYGAAGTDGFGQVLVTDRYHEGGHSLYFRREFIRQYWTPFLHEGRIVEGTGVQRQGIPWPIKLLGMAPLNLVVLMLAVGLLAGVLYGGYVLASPLWGSEKPGAPYASEGTVPKPALPVTTPLDGDQHSCVQAKKLLLQLESDGYEDAYAAAFEVGPLPGWCFLSAHTLREFVDPQVVIEGLPHEVRHAQLRVFAFRQGSGMRRLIGSAPTFEGGVATVSLAGRVPAGSRIFVMHQSESELDPDVRLRLKVIHH